MSPLAIRRLARVAIVAAIASVPPPVLVAQQSINSLVSDARSELERMNEFGKLESQSRQLMKDGRFDEARRVAMRAMELNVSNRRAKLLLGDIDAAEKAAAPPPPVGPVREPGARRPEGVPPRGRTDVPVDRGRADRARSGEVAGRAAQAVRDTVRAYLSGDYAAALAVSQAAGDSAPPRVWLYAACSEVALGLLDRAEADQRFARARELFARAQASGQAFTADRQVISPRVWDVLATP